MSFEGVRVTERIKNEDFALFYGMLIKRGGFFFKNPDVYPYEVLVQYQFEDVEAYNQFKEDFRRYRTNIVEKPYKKPNIFVRLKRKFKRMF